MVIGAFVLQDILLLSYSIGARSGLSSIDDVCKSFIFFADLADSLFIVSSNLLGLANRQFWHSQLFQQIAGMSSEPEILCPVCRRFC